MHLKKNNLGFSKLENSYKKVGDKTWEYSDFQKSNLKTSLSLFNKINSDEKIIPKNLEVYALVSGLPFNKKFIDKIWSIQKNIDKIIFKKKKYWVERKNLAFEYCVFKWPDDEWNLEKNKIVLQTLKKLELKKFIYTIRGFQVNKDGCVILRGYDRDNFVNNLRAEIFKTIKFLPKKQSQWIHIPIGRILEPVGKNKFKMLKEYILKNSSNVIGSTLINEIKYVHETQWYMTKKSFLKKIKLS